MLSHIIAPLGCLENFVSFSLVSGRVHISNIYAYMVELASKSLLLIVESTNMNKYITINKYI